MFNFTLDFAPISMKNMDGEAMIGWEANRIICGTDEQVTVLNFRLLGEMKSSVFVTVGSTKFEKLIQAVDSVEFGEALVDSGYNELIVQKGMGIYCLRNLLPPGETDAVLASGLSVRCFDYVPSIADIVEKADLLICHAGHPSKSLDVLQFGCLQGAGSIFEGLEARKKLIVVPNDLLMDNHQIEIAEELERMGHLMSATPESLLHKVKCSRVFQAIPYVPSTPFRIVQSIDHLFIREKKRQ